MFQICILIEYVSMLLVIFSFIVFIKIVNYINIRVKNAYESLNGIFNKLTGIPDTRWVITRNIPDG